MNQNQQSQLKDLITKGKEQGFLTYAQVNDHLPDDIVDPEQIEDIVNMINDMGIQVHEDAPDSDDIILNDEATTDTDDDTAAEEAARVRKLESKLLAQGVGELAKSLSAQEIGRASCRERV